MKVLDSNQTQEDWRNVDGDFVMARLSKLPALVLSQTCDVQTKAFFIQLAPIFSAQADAKYVERLRKNEVISAFWLTEHPPEVVEESYADFELIQAVHQSYLKRIRPDQHFRLSGTRTRALQRSITRYFGRPNSFDAGSDTAPAAATYLCVSCFYLDARITTIDLVKDEPFRICETCGGRGWVIKGR